MMFQNDNGRSLSKALRVGLVALALVASSQAFARGEGGGGGGGGGDGGGAEAGGNAVAGGAPPSPNGEPPARGRRSAAPTLIIESCPQWTNRIFC